MRLGDADAERLTLLGRFYDPSSAAFIDSLGVEAGDAVVDLGCGHGAVTDTIAARVGDTGTVSWWMHRRISCGLPGRDERLGRGGQ